jgi:mannosyl-3-phosphoglycerate phosphatase
MNKDRSFVMFTDVDGTLLDSRTRSCDGAAEALDLLAREQIPLVLCSSKTRAELEVVQQQLGIRDPFVCENGGGVFVPRGYFACGVPNARDIAGYEAVELGRPYGDVVDALHRIAARARVEVIGFSDMSIEDVAFECDMPLMQARLAKLREYDEPFRILDASPSAQPSLQRAARGASRLYERRPLRARGGRRG